MNRNGCLIAMGFVAGVVLSKPALADQYHYMNILQGDRAQGMGGAFTAIADDASGLVYNPAGLAFALSNDISGSANAFYSREIIYEKTLGDSDFVEKSGGSVPSFFGILQKLDKYVPGMVGAFGNYFIDSDLKDQDDLIEDKTIGSTEIRRFHRTVNSRASTNLWAAAVGYRLSSNMALGFGLGYFEIDELVQEYQDGKQSLASQDGFWRVLTQNVVTRLSVTGIEPVIGWQMALGGKFSIGATIKKGIITSQKLEVTTENRTTFFSDSQLADLENPASIVGTSGANQIINRETNNEPFGSMPMQARVGFAWFASTRFLLALDVIHHGATSDAAEIEAFGKKLYEREAVTNFALGTEYYIAPSIPLRFGLFSNNDARPEVDEGEPDAAAGETCQLSESFKEKYCGQPDHIDYWGESLFIAWVQPNSQIAAGFILQQGTGKSQKLGDHQVQDVKASANTFAFSATHNF